MDLFSFMYADMRKCGVLPSGSLFESLVKSGIAKFNVDWAVTIYRDSSVRIGSAGKPSKLARNILYTELVTQCNLFETFRALGVSFALGHGDEDVAYLDKLMYGIVIQSITLTEETHIAVLKGWDILGQVYIESAQAVAANDDAKYQASLGLDSNARMHHLPRVVGMDADVEWEGVREVKAELIVEREQQLKPPEPWPLPIASFMLLLRACILRDKAFAPPEAVQALRKMWASVGNHPNSPVMSLKLLLEYVSLLISNGLWSDVRSFMTQKLWLSVDEGEGDKQAMAARLDVFVQRLRQLAREHGGFPSDIVDRIKGMSSPPR